MAYFVLSRSKVYENLSSLEPITDMVSYSWKTNIQIGAIINQDDKHWLSVHGLRELAQVETKRNVWYFGMAWRREELEELFSLGLDHFVVDNEEDLDALIGLATEKNYRVHILLRMKLKEMTIFTGKHYVFGMSSYTIRKRVPELKRLEVVDGIGVHFHRKTQNVSEWSLTDEVLDALGEEILASLDYINIGGGLPGKYKNTNDKAIESIFEKLRGFRNFCSERNIKVIVEPGRYVASSPVELHAKILAIHDDTIFLDVSCFNGMLDTIVANVKLLVRDELESGKRYLLKGCTPDSSDILRYSVYLDEPKVGDEIVFLNCGAYNFATDFCALPKIETRIVD